MSPEYKTAKIVSKINHNSLILQKQCWHWNLHGATDGVQRFLCLDAEERIKRVPRWRRCDSLLCRQLCQSAEDPTYTEG